jgi:phosphomannomutase
MSIFKAYDIRGIYPYDFNEDIAYLTGLAIADLFKPDVVVVGRDARMSSDSISSSLIMALTKHNCKIIDIGMVSTPMLYYYAGAQKIPLGIMVTASHNPANYNGLKICHNGAKPVSSEQIANIGQTVELLKHEVHIYQRLAPEAASYTREIVDPFPQYVKHIQSLVSFKTSFRIAADTANAICGHVIPKVFSGLPVAIIPLYFEVDGRFPNHQPDPLKKENTAELQRKVLEHKCHFGAALDGDGDRVMFIDEKGQYVPADMASLLIALDLAEKEPPPRKVVIDTRVSKAAVEVLNEHGIEVIRGRVGHSLVKAKIYEVGAYFGAELSGHYYFRDSFRAENSDLAIVSMLNILERTGRPLSELIHDHDRYFQSGEINFIVGNKQGILDRICEQYSDGRISFIDGVTVEYPSWWINVRPSNTEDILRLNVEAHTKSELKKRTDEVSEFIKQASKETK